MISNIKIENFKSLKSCNLMIKNLNLFTGINGTGKSSFIQSLLLLRQSFYIGFLTRPKQAIFLGDDETLVRLGNFKDVYNYNATNNENVLFQIHDNDNQILKFESVNYNVEDKDKPRLDGKLTANVADFESLSLFNDRFQYLSAERIGPNESYPRFKDEETLGKDGRYTAHFLEKNRSSNVTVEELIHSTVTSTKNLIVNVNAWMREICPEIEIITNENPLTNRVELTYRYKSNLGIPTQESKPQNMGFGITYSLPIVVSILSSRPGDIIIIENPETHLHPRGQSRLGILIAIAAQAGVQLFVESHSDHILNGIRVAAKQKQIENELIKIYFFTRKDHNSDIKSLSISEDGKIGEWPEDFFDEWGNMLDQLI